MPVGVCVGGGGVCFVLLCLGCVLWCLVCVCGCLFIVVCFFVFLLLFVCGVGVVGWVYLGRWVVGGLVLMGVSPI